MTRYPQTWLRLGTLCLCVLVGCITGNGDPVAQDAKSESAPEKKSDAAPKKQFPPNNYLFSFELFKQLHKSGENTFVSPVSVSMALHMLAEGAAGETRRELQQALRVEGKDLNEINRRLLDQLENRDVQFDIANSLWVDRNKIALNEKYAADMTKYFEAGVFDAEFDESDSIEKMNKWVAERTNGKISKLLDELDPDTAMCLINAICFKGSWKVPFKHIDNELADFTLPDGTKQLMKMMNREDKFDWGKDGNTTVARLPYVDPDVSMWVALPEEGKLDNLIAELGANTLTRWKEVAKESELDFRIPRFAVRQRQSLEAALKALGIKRAWSAQDADFAIAGKSKDGLSYPLDQVTHEAVIEVTEEGTEAAAATVVARTAKEPLIDAESSLYLDRPFLLVIVDDKTNSIMFVGAVNKPE